MRTPLALVFAAGLALLVPSQGHAAPQMLGVIASASPIKLHCDAGVCQTRLSTFCLQAERDTPGYHQVYEPHDPSGFAVVARTETGETVRTHISGAVFQSVWGYTAVEVRIPEAPLRARGLTPVGFEVSGQSLLIPEPEAGDDDPIGADEIALAVMTLQPAAKRVFAKRERDVTAVRYVNTLLNETPTRGRMAREERKSLLENAFGDDIPERDKAGSERASDILGYCRNRMETGHYFSLRRCLEHRLHGMLTDLNTEYWRATRPGW